MRWRSSGNNLDDLQENCENLIKLEARKPENESSNTGNLKAGDENGEDKIRSSCTIEMRRRGREKQKKARWHHSSSKSMNQG
ncbi:hypothetical protein NPIL_116341 [Nephila pilipes]|uniref:Uncharacterized protein n=1 Tax=Nephila pilipes TaxID=299642 RepID=A0A8X6PZD3_NEPPI|nr:hypothetical protein NPIL_116341 [Nephila pilipes]